MGLGDRIGTIAAGYEADVIALDGDPRANPAALGRVVFVMRGGRVYKNEPPRAATAEAQSLDPAARQALRAEVDAFFDQYYAWYSAGAADEIAGYAYNVPYVRGDGSALGTRDEVRQWVAEAWARLDAQGYAGSDMPDRNICVLGVGSVIVSGRGVRYHRDGGLLGEYGWTYTVVMTDDGWRILSIFGHDPALAVRCP